MGGNRNSCGENRPRLPISAIFVAKSSYSAPSMNYYTRTGSRRNGYGTRNGLRIYGAPPRAVRSLIQINNRVCAGVQRKESTNEWQLPPPAAAKALTLR